MDFNLANILNGVPVIFPIATPPIVPVTPPIIASTNTGSTTVNSKMAEVETQDDLELVDSLNSLVDVFNKYIKKIDSAPEVNSMLSNNLESTSNIAKSISTIISNITEVTKVISNIDSNTINNKLVKQYSDVSANYIKDATAPYIEQTMESIKSEFNEYSVLNGMLDLDQIEKAGINAITNNDSIISKITNAISGPSNILTNIDNTNKNGANVSTLDTTLTSYLQNAYDKVSNTNSSNPVENSISNYTNSPNMKDIVNTTVSNNSANSYLNSLPSVVPSNIQNGDSLQSSVYSQYSIMNPNSLISNPTSILYSALPNITSSNTVSSLFNTRENSSASNMLNNSSVLNNRDSSISIEKVSSKDIMQYTVDSISNTESTNNNNRIIESKQNEVLNRLSESITNFVEKSSANTSTLKETISNSNSININKETPGSDVNVFSPTINKNSSISETSSNVELSNESIIKLASIISASIKSALQDLK